MLGAALVVSYFAGPTLNFGDFSRYAKTISDMKKGNFWGLPVNFLFFSLISVVTISGTRAVFGELIVDPIATRSADNENHETKHRQIYDRPSPIHETANGLHTA